jgi:hypothetical protein
MKYIIIEKSQRNPHAQAINEISVDGYKVWTGLPRRTRPIWDGSIKTPEEQRVEDEFEDEVMAIANTLWYIVLESAKPVK